MRLPCEVMFYQSKLTIKCIFAFYQIYFCLLSNVNMIAVKCNLIYSLLYIRLFIFIVLFVF